MSVAHRTRGLSIVELLVGIALGLFVLAGATMLVTGQLSDNRRLLLETQVQQDLRAAADMIARDIRRGGFWGNAATGVWPATGAPPVGPNPYRVARQETGGGRSEWMYSYSDTAPPFIVENDTENSWEMFGYALDASSGTIEMQIGGNWQALTDPNVIRVTQFNLPITQQIINVPCSKACPGGGVACWPQQAVHDIGIVITAQAVHDAAVQRSIRADVRLRNDVRLPDNGVRRELCPV